MKNSNKNDSTEYFLWKSKTSGPFDLEKISKELFKRLQKKIPNAGGALMIASAQREVLRPSVFIDQEKFIYKAVDRLLKKPLHEFEVSQHSQNPIAQSWRNNAEIEGSIEYFCIEMIPKSIASKMGFISKRRRLMAFPIEKLGVLVVSNTKPLNESQKKYVRNQKKYISDLIKSISSYKDSLTSHLDRVMKLQRIFGKIFSSSNLDLALKNAEKTLSAELGTEVLISLKEKTSRIIALTYITEIITHKGQRLGYIHFRKPIKQADRDLLQIIAKELGLALFVVMESLKVRDLVNDLLVRGLVEEPETPSIKFTLRLTPSLNSNIELLASQQKKSKADFMRDLLQRGVDDEMGFPRTQPDDDIESDRVF